MGLFSVASGWGNQNLPCISYSDEIWHTYTLPKKDQKIYKTRDISLEFSNNSNFSPEISKFCYFKKYRYRLDLGI